MLDAPFEISNQCCNVMKKSPAHEYQKTTGMQPITAQTASESRLRTQQWLNNGCNGFELKRPISNPMSFWTEQDILLYIYTRNEEILEWRRSEYREVIKRDSMNYSNDEISKIIEEKVKSPLASVYGQVVKEKEMNGQIDLKDLGLFDLDRPTMKTTGCNRTGCIPCLYGAHREKPCDSRIQKIIDYSNPKIADWMLRGGHFDENGLWKPYKGLGYWFLFEWVKKYGDIDIWYPNREYYIEKYSTPETDRYLK